MKLIKSLLLALGLSLSALSAQAAVIYHFTGTVDPGSAQAGQTFSGSLSFDEVAPDFEGSVSLLQFSLSFLGQDYSLLDADFEPLAWFTGGQFLGVDFYDTDDSSRASVTLTAGFVDLGEAFFSYGSGAEIEGGGVLVFEREAAAVPLPGTLALAGLGLLALQRRRRA